jgi:alpha-ribazole phosphatase
LVMKITLIRHPQPSVPTGLCFGHLDVSLVEGWQSKAHDCLPTSERNVDLLVSSDLMRCKLLTQFFAENLFQSLPIIETALLRELHFGTWEGRHWNSISQDESLYWTEDLDNQAPPGGESQSQLRARVVAVISDLLDRGSRHALLVTHAGVIRALYSIADNASTMSSSTIPVAYLSTHTFQVLPSPSRTPLLCRA